MHLCCECFQTDTCTQTDITCNPDHIHWISIEQMLERQSTIQGQTHTHTHDR